MSFLVSVSRGAVLSGILICLLPAAAGADSIWFAMPITETAVAAFVIFRILRDITRLSVAANPKNQE